MFHILKKYNSRHIIQKCFVVFFHKKYFLYVITRITPEGRLLDGIEVSSGGVNMFHILKNIIQDIPFRNVL
jgi:hypothetical protein